MEPFGFVLIRGRIWGKTGDLRLGWWGIWGVGKEAGSSLDRAWLARSPGSVKPSNWKKKHGGNLVVEAKSCEEGRRDLLLLSWGWWWWWGTCVCVSEVEGFYSWPW